MTPVELKQLSSDTLGIRWSDGHESMYHARLLRLHCPCAVCVDEWTRERRVSEQDVAQDIKPKSIESVGRYALNIQWNDGHDTGFYTFPLLRSLCECAQCRPH